jgi:hypothetical protein
MEMSPRQRKAVFALIVMVLAVLGVYLVWPGAFGGTPSRPAAQTASTRGAARHQEQAGTGSPAAAPGGSPAAPQSATPAVPDIYQWLPFTQAELASAAAVVTQFSRAYGTWSYTQSASAYTDSMSSLVVPELVQVLAQAYSVPGVASARTSGRQASAGTAVINSLRAFGPSSMTFVVTISQEITGAGGTSQLSGQYAVTVTGSGSAWQVSDIELASAGNS